MKSNKLNILFPTDFSDNAWSALVYALKLYKNEFCTFYFLHSSYISNSVPRTYITTHYVDELQKEAKGKLNELKGQIEIANSNSNHDFEIILSEKELKNAIENAVKQNDIDIVVMGTKGATDSIEFFMGSNTVGTIQKIKNCPILVVPDEHEFAEPKQIAFPTNYNRFYDDKELRPLKEMAELYNSKIRVLHINVETKLSEIQEYNMKMLDDYLSHHKHSFHWLPDYTKKSKAIAAFIEDLQIELLAMVNNKHSLLESILNEPVIKNIAFHPTVPILVIPE